jgi:hypothetical protein
MLGFHKLSPKTRFRVACILLVAAAVLISPWLGFRGEDAPGTYIEGVANHFGKDPRLTVVRVDKDAGQIVVTVNPTQKTLTFTAERAALKKATMREGAESWKFSWRDKDDRVLSVGDFVGVPTKSIQIPVPGLP